MSLNLLTHAVRGRAGFWSQQAPRGSWPKEYGSGAPREQQRALDSKDKRRVWVSSWVVLGCVYFVGGLCILA